MLIYTFPSRSAAADRDFFEIQSIKIDKNIRIPIYKIPLLFYAIEKGGMYLGNQNRCLYRA